MPPTRPQRSNSARTIHKSHRSTLFLLNDRGTIHVYDLLPTSPGALNARYCTLTFMTREMRRSSTMWSKEFQGTSGPGWLNRAASIGVALPCVVPREWIDPPEYDMVDGELLDEDEDEDDGTHEGSRMLKQSPPRFHGEPRPEEGQESGWGSEDDRRHGGSGKGKQVERDQAGRTLPASERAPRP
ncbi:conserved hypothetical protein [Verticillium alfalfae VaMs.102]|uniref:Uncharacterized protein n=1 Tax=Verticillium alfalfae (strain VaMs.102 / ATCC MYA-4576 / FGSC 10136) TaxID=526221 RepID=C9SN31_VERA1|nr:conserved hypothetical protein [Verticillium alfalfae VaMs.102]EEY20196.1 conserved hypothetical protein [Verticillium alfalfae VaMs.102]